MDRPGRGRVRPGGRVSALREPARLVYVKEPAPGREPRLTQLLARIEDDDRAAYKHFRWSRELAQLVARDLAVLLSERFAQATAEIPGSTVPRHAPLAALPDPPTGQQGDSDISLDAAFSLARLGFLAERNGELGEARARHLESLDVAADLQHPPAIALALTGIAAVTAATGDPDSAAQLLGGAASLRERSDVPVDDVDAADVQRAHERTRAGLDAETFDIAHLSGKKLTLTQLLDLARNPRDAEAAKLGGLDRIVTANHVGEPRSKRSVEERNRA